MSRLIEIIIYLVYNKSLLLEKNGFNNILFTVPLKIFTVYLKFQNYARRK